MSEPDLDGMTLTGAVTVEIGSITTPETFERLPDAVKALWDSVSLLDLWLPLYNDMAERLSGPGTVERIATALRRDGVWTSEIFVGDGRPYLVTIQLRETETDE